MFTFDYESYRQEDGYFYYTYIILLTKGSLKDHYYLGQHRTRNLNDNYKGSGKILSNYYKKYRSDDDFVFEIMNFYRNSEELNAAEKSLIEDRYKDDEMCLNLVAGGSAFWKGRHHTDEAKQKMSNVHKGRQFTDEHKHKISNALKGHQFTDETKQKLSNAQKGKHLTDETKQKMSNIHKGQIPWIKGKHHTDEAKQKMSNIHKGTHHTDETKQKISDANKGQIPWNKGKHHTDEAKQKISNALKGKYKGRIPWNKGLKVKNSLE